MSTTLSKNLMHNLIIIYLCQQNNNGICTLGKNLAFLHLKECSFSSSTGLRPIYVMFFKCLLISFSNEKSDNDDMWL